MKDGNGINLCSAYLAYIIIHRVAADYNVHMKGKKFMLNKKGHVGLACTLIVLSTKIKIMLPSIIIPTSLPPTKLL